MMSLNRVKTLLATGLLATVGWAGAASAVTVTFDNITNNTTDIASQLVLEVVDVGTGAQFTFSGATGPATSFGIAEIYFDDDTPVFVAPPVEIASSPGVVFEEGGVNTPANLPGGNTVGFSATSGMVAESTGRNANTIGVGEFYTVELTYAVGQDFDDFLAALEDGSFNVGMHVRSINGGTSDAYVNLPPVPPVPLPAAGLLLLGALGGLGLARRRRRA